MHRTLLFTIWILTITSMYGQNSLQSSPPIKVSSQTVSNDMGWQVFEFENSDNTIFSPSFWICPSEIDEDTMTSYTVYLNGVYAGCITPTEDVISNSWSTTEDYDLIRNAIDSATNFGRNGKGCILTFAVGNQGQQDSIRYPARYYNKPIIAVTAIDPTGHIPSFSNHGRGIFCAAPGVSILSSLPNNRYANLSGTSMATPAVAGIAALILERNPNLTVQQVRDIIKQNCVRYSWVSNLVYNANLGLFSLDFGYGVPDAYQCVINTPKP